MSRRALVVALAIAATIACKRDDATTKDQDISSGRKPIAAAGGTKGASKHLEDDDDDDGPAKPKPGLGGRLVSKEGNFRVDFPTGMVVPEEKIVPVPTDVGTVQMHNFMHESKDETTGAAFVDYPPGHVLRSGGASFVLGNVEKGAVASMIATVDHDAEVTVDGRLARDFTFVIAGPPAQYGRQFATLVGDRLYQLIYITSAGKSDVDSPRVRAFFASFHVAP